jgi:hypothetical protein
MDGPRQPMLAAAGERHVRDHRDRTGRGVHRPGRVVLTIIGKV